MKIPDAKAAVDKELEKLENVQDWRVAKVKCKREVIEKPQNESRTVHVATVMDLCYIKNSELEQKVQKYEGRVVLQGDVAEDDSRSYLLPVFTEQGSSASQMATATVLDAKVRELGCAGQASDAVSAYTKGKNGGRSEPAETSQVRMC